MSRPLGHEKNNRYGNINDVQNANQSFFFFSSRSIAFDRFIIVLFFFVLLHLLNDSRLSCDTLFSFSLSFRHTELFFPSRAGLLFALSTGPPHLSVHIIRSPQHVVGDPSPDIDKEACFIFPNLASIRTLHFEEAPLLFYHSPLLLPFFVMDEMGTRRDRLLIMISSPFRR